MKYLFFSLFFLVSSAAFADVRLMLETGAVWQHRNDVKIPGNTGTRLDFDEFNQGPFFHYRLETRYWWSDKHSVRLLLAPFQFKVKGNIKENVVFDDETFTAGQELEISYRFNSYRLSYIYGFWGKGEDQLNLGITGKIRDAEFVFKQSGLEASNSNVGFVPLIYFEYLKALGNDWAFNLNMDAAAAPQGRAIDIAMKLRRQISSDYEVGIGARTLEGGADNDKVFTFSWFNYVVLDIVGQF